PTRHAAGSPSVVSTDSRQLASAGPWSVEADQQSRGTGTMFLSILNSVPEPMDPEAVTTLSAMLGYSNGTLEKECNANPPRTIEILSPTDPANPGAWSLEAGATAELQWSIDGYSFSMSISGRPLDEDSFSVSFNEGGVADNRNALLMSELQSRQVLGQADGA